MEDKCILYRKNALSCHSALDSHLFTAISTSEGSLTFLWMPFILRAVMDFTATTYKKLEIDPGQRSLRHDLLAQGAQAGALDIPVRSLASARPVRQQLHQLASLVPAAPALPNLGYPTRLDYVWSSPADTACAKTFLIFQGAGGDPLTGGAKTGEGRTSLRVRRRGLSYCLLRAPIDPIVVDPFVFHARFKGKLPRVRIHSGCDTFVVSDRFISRNRFQKAVSSPPLRVELATPKTSSPLTPPGAAHHLAKGRRTSPANTVMSPNKPSLQANDLEGSDLEPIEDRAQCDDRDADGYGDQREPAVRGVASAEEPDRERAREKYHRPPQHLVHGRGDVDQADVRQCCYGLVAEGGEPQKEVFGACSSTTSPSISGRATPPNPPPTPPTTLNRDAIHALLAAACLCSSTDKARQSWE
ncbi:hypothetical protein BDK51DRAFT_42455 [Blyttiomyces helicus]|uniref:Uncharacterized protein n=1 Tax=Blyttiomyces helicus TaxID=388810 RepID=A0A4P9WM49_9FUNG|nr:hypothetical protein BDK51DRAFT_42455 [Blyttiomyces helicus]|eukprot:RKO94139.1 hypothetical protein BDK51DRAFT_42455 [Blyttiomyces helicus]